jgi:hypothetical protein
LKLAGTIVQAPIEAPHNHIPVSSTVAQWRSGAILEESQRTSA